MSYNGSIDLISGLRPKNNGTFPLLQAKDVQTREDGTRLDTELEELKKGTGGDTTALEQRVKALEQDSEDINTELQGVADRVSDLEKGGTGTDVILVASEADLPDDAEDGTIAVIERAESEEEESGGESGGSGGESGGSTTDATLEAAKTYTDEQITKYWTEAEVFDLTTVFDFAQSVAKGGTLEATTYDNADELFEKMKNEPVKIKVAFNGLTATVSVLAQYFPDGGYCQFTDFVVINNNLLYLYLLVNGGTSGILAYQCQQVQTTPYNPS